MKYFEQNELMAAIRYSLAGGQAICVFPADREGFPNAPKCFKKTGLWGHLLDQDKDRLMATAKRLGVHVIRVGKVGMKTQHIDLCGGPLERAIMKSENCPF